MLGLEEVVEVTHAVLFPLLGEIEHLSDESALSQSLLRGSVTIAGGSEAIVTVDCSPLLARRIGGAMFEEDPDALSEEEVRDALGEVANIIGGNIKAMLPGPSQLGLPEIESGVFDTPPKALVEQAFDCTGEPFRVCLAERS